MSVSHPAASRSLTNGFWGVKSYHLELSRGVALAVSCTYGGPCEKLVAIRDAPPGDATAGNSNGSPRWWRSRDAVTRGAPVVT